MKLKYIYLNLIKFIEIQIKLMTKNYNKLQQNVATFSAGFSSTKIGLKFFFF